jgi:hypothetical protein
MIRRKSFEIYNLTSNITKKYRKNKKRQFRGYVLRYRKPLSRTSYPTPITIILYIRCLLS